MSSSLAQIRRFLVMTAGFWLVAAGPAWLLAGVHAIEGLTYAVVLCAIPGVVALQVPAGRSGGNQALTGLLVGMGLRMAVVLAAALMMQELRPDLGLVEFHVWLVLAYFMTLAVETRMLLTKERPDSQSGSNVGSRILA